MVVSLEGFIYAYFCRGALLFARGFRDSFLALIISSALDMPISYMEKKKIPRILGALITLFLSWVYWLFFYI